MEIEDKLALKLLFVIFYLNFFNLTTLFLPFLLTTFFIFNIFSNFIVMLFNYSYSVYNIHLACVSKDGLNICVEWRWWKFSSYSVINSMLFLFLNSYSMYEIGLYFLLENKWVPHRPIYDEKIFLVTYELYLFITWVVCLLYELYVSCTFNIVDWLA